MSKISVLVTGVGGGGHGEQIMKALKMREDKYSIIGCDMSACSKGLKDVDYAYLVPAATKTDEYLDKILNICQKHQIKAIFHGSEPELMVLSKHRELFTSNGIMVPINPHGLVETCMVKSKTFSFLENNGFNYPKTMIIGKMDDVDRWDIFPAVLKPSIGSGGSAHTYIVQDAEEFQIIAKYVLKLQVTSELIVQEYKGSDKTEFTVGVLHDMDGQFINSIAIRRDLSSSLSCRVRVPNRTKKKNLGEFLSISTGISQGEIGPFPEITKTCEDIARKLGAKGPINVQCRFHEGEVFVFEINPRFSGTTSLRAMVGYNEPDILIRRHILGEKIESRFAYKSGTIMRGLTETFFENL